MHNIFITNGYNGHIMRKKTIEYQMFCLEGDKMAKSEPLRTNDDIEVIKKYFLDRNRIRDYVLFTLGINTALRISDLLRLTWGDVLDFNTDLFFNHITVTEKKTHKKTIILINHTSKAALEKLRTNLNKVIPQNYIFKSRAGDNQPIHRSRAYCIIKEAALANHIEGVICCHSMRKTFGYHAWKEGFPPAIIMDIYNHSSIETTKRYLSINQDDKDYVFHKLQL